MRLLTTSILLSTIFLASCATPYLLQEQRTKYELTENNGLVLSTLDKDNQAQPVRLMGGLRFGVTVYVQNTGNSPKAVRLSEAKATVQDLSLPVKCDSQPSASTTQLTLVQNLLAKLSCKAIIDVKHFPELQKKDQWLQFAIPFTREGSKPSEIVFHYKTKTEDFQ